MVTREAATAQAANTMATCVQTTLASEGRTAGEAKCPHDDVELSYAACDEQSMEPPPEEERRRRQLKYAAREEPGAATTISARGDLAMPAGGEGWSGDGSSMCISDPSTCDSQLSIAFRLNLHGGDETAAYILSSGGQTDSTGVYVNWEGDTKLCAGVNVGSHSWTICDSTYGENKDVYHHVAIVLKESFTVRSNPKRELELYIDGAKRGAKAAGITSSDSAQASNNVYRSIVLGAPNNSPDEYRALAEVDDLMFFDRSLTADEVAALAGDCGCFGGTAGYSVGTRTVVRSKRRRTPCNPMTTFTTLVSTTPLVGALRKTFI